MLLVQEFLYSHGKFVAQFEKSLFAQNHRHESKKDNEFGRKCDKLGEAIEAVGLA